mmetsp:Transcript_6460/g.20107  ORF Transcript_6460/g.20107 Transcript_6460/m.20107 type:complete len:317 (-) Transcript_6460:2249-3199(-)|eukprot:351934-Chlamydomonas_euryale.AAC.5
MKRPTPRNTRPVDRETSCISSTSAGTRPGVPRSPDQSLKSSRSVEPNVWISAGEYGMTSASAGLLASQHGSTMNDMRLASNVGAAAGAGTTAEASLGSEVSSVCRLGARDTAVQCERRYGSPSHGSFDSSGSSSSKALQPPPSGSASRSADISGASTASSAETCSAHAVLSSGEKTLGAASGSTPPSGTGCTVLALDFPALPPFAPLAPLPPLPPFPPFPDAGALAAPPAPHHPDATAAATPSRMRFSALREYVRTAPRNASIAAASYGTAHTTQRVGRGAGGSMPLLPLPAATAPSVAAAAAAAAASSGKFSAAK